MKPVTEHSQSCPPYAACYNEHEISPSFFYNILLQIKKRSQLTLTDAMNALKRTKTRKRLLIRRTSLNTHIRYTHYSPLSNRSVSMSPYWILPLMLCQILFQNKFFIHFNPQARFRWHCTETVNKLKILFI